VDIYNHPDLSTVARIHPDGACSFPLLGRVAVGGLGIRELADLLKKRLEKEYLTYAHVSAFVKEWAPRKAYVLGAVVQPGAYSVDPRDGLTLLKLLALARGFLPHADKDRVSLLRADGDHKSAYTVPVLALLEGRFGPLDVPLNPGDRVFVPTLRKIYVLGSVRNPRGIEMNAEEPLTLTRAVSLAGGYADDADRSAVLWLRRGAGGDTVRVVDTGGLEQGRNPAHDPVLDAGDTLIVRTRQKVFVLGSVTRPGGFDIPDAGLTATQAVSLAGGFSKRADMDGTMVIRVVSGRKRMIPVPVSDVVSEEEERGVRLRPGDIVYVPERLF
jgi:polysaccharide export outer membrane protein